MRLTLLIAMLLALAGCKESGWTFMERHGGEAPAATEPREGQSGKDIIYVLGIDGMD